MKKHESSIIGELNGKSYSLITPQLLSKAVEKGGKIAKDIWNLFSERLEIFLSILINFANPDTIVLCCGLSHAENYQRKLK